MSFLLRHKKVTNMVNKLSLFPHEIFEKVQAVRAMKDRVAILQENSSFALRTILQVNFNNWIKFDLPEGNAPFKEDTNPPEFSAGRIDNAIRILKLLTVESKLPKVKKEMKFIQLLESVNVKDAKIIVAMKDKNIQDLYPAITPVLVKKAFPNLIKDK